MLLELVHISKVQLAQRSGRMTCSCGQKQKKESFQLFQPQHWSKALNFSSQRSGQGLKHYKSLSLGPVQEIFSSTVTDALHN